MKKPIHLLNALPPEVYILAAIAFFSLMLGMLLQKPIHHAIEHTVAPEQAQTSSAELVSYQADDISDALLN